VTRAAFHRKARAEYRATVEYYKAERASLGAHFAAEVRAAVEFLTTLPEASAVQPDGTRHKRLRTFPFKVVYRIVGDVVEIVAVCHQRQKPGYWSSRL
jgi:plasmid stabilization system protein ParE